MNVAGFGSDPFWLILLKVVALFALLVVIVLLTIWGERRVVARMQSRVGPNRVGPFGLLQSLMDGFKLALRKRSSPQGGTRCVRPGADPVSRARVHGLRGHPFRPGGLHLRADHDAATDGLPGQRPVRAGDRVDRHLRHRPGRLGVRFDLSAARWSAQHRAQMISYEIAMGLSFVAVFLFAGSASTSEIVNAQTKLWYVLLLLPSFVIYTTSMVGETNRAPFDLPEAEGELVGGFTPSTRL